MILGLKTILIILMTWYTRKDKLQNLEWLLFFYELLEIMTEQELKNTVQKILKIDENIKGCLQYGKIADFYDKEDYVGASK